MSNLRVGDLERAAVCDELSAQFAAGRLDDRDFEERLNVAVAAGTRRELGLLLVDLPRAPNQGPAGTHGVTQAATLGWTALDALALLTVLGCGAIALFVVLVVGASDSAGALLAAALLGGLVALLAGGSLAHLAHRGLERHAARYHSAPGGPTTETL